MLYEVITRDVDQQVDDRDQDDTETHRQREVALRVPDFAGDVRGIDPAIVGSYNFV